MGWTYFHGDVDENYSSSFDYHGWEWYRNNAELGRFNGWIAINRIRLLFITKVSFWDCILSICFIHVRHLKSLYPEKDVTWNDKEIVVFKHWFKNIAFQSLFLWGRRWLRKTVYYNSSWCSKTWFWIETGRNDFEKENQVW